MKGIDISSCNWDNGGLDFSAIRNDGVEVVIIKATEGIDFRDYYLDNNYNGANGTIPHIGFYHFMSERTEPRQQARDFYEAIKDKSYDVKPCLDIENNSWGRSANEVTNRCLEFIDEFRNISGQDVMVYTGGYFGRDELDDRIKCYGGWIAHYGADYPMETGFPVVGHQYSESGRVYGISGNVDMNNFNEGIFLGNANVGHSTFVSTSDPISKAREFVGDRCLELQQSLIAKGYNCGGCGADGKFGQGTYNSLVQFQQDSGLDADGLAGEQTFTKLNENNQPQTIVQPVPQPQCDNVVLQLQQLINSQGFGPVTEDGITGQDTLNHCPTVQEGANGQITQWIQLRVGANADGDFGPGTRDAVIGFQSSRGLGCDGIVGTNTWRALLGM